MAKNTNNEVRFTVIAGQSLVDDIKFISAWERKKQKELINEIFTSFISDWKTKNKGVKFPS